MVFGHRTSPVLSLVEFSNPGGFLKILLLNPVILQVRKLGSKKFSILLKVAGLVDGCQQHKMLNCLGFPHCTLPKKGTPVTGLFILEYAFIT